MGRKVRPKLAVNPGDLVLIGKAGISLPNDWFLARILWAEGDDILAEHTPAGGEKYRQVLDVSMVRAVGTIEELGDYRRKADALVRDRKRRVHDLNDALRRAREAVWTKLDEIAAEIPGAVP